MTHVKTAADNHRLVVDYQDQPRELTALWLREHSPAPDTLDPRTGQRLI